MACRTCQLHIMAKRKATDEDGTEESPGKRQATEAVKENQKEENEEKPTEEKEIKAPERLSSDGKPHNLKVEGSTVDI